MSVYLELERRYRSSPPRPPRSAVEGEAFVRKLFESAAYHRNPTILWCPEGDLNPHDRLRSADFKSAVSLCKYLTYKELRLQKCGLCKFMCKFCRFSIIAQLLFWAVLGTSRAERGVNRTAGQAQRLNPMSMPWLISCLGVSASLEATEQGSALGRGS